MDSSFTPIPPPDDSASAGGGSSTDPEGTVISGGKPPPPIVATSMDEIGRVLEGHSLGPYFLERFVGGGGMGAVFRAHDTTLDRIVAVKVLSRQQSSDADMLRRFRNEAQLAARLDHENIGRVYAVGTDGGWHYIVFEFIEGTNLRDVVMDEGPLDLPRAIRFTVQVAEALEHAWQRSVVHRDIKPSNIIITPAGRARLVDMGLARLPAVSGTPDLTASGMTLGTFDYISPEQARDPRAADVRSDLYSLGCTLFYMLTGRPPFADGTVVQKLLQHQQTPPPDVTAERADVTEGLARVVDRLLRKSPDERYQRPADLVAELVTVADGLGIELDSEMVPGALAELPLRPYPRAHWRWMVPVAALLVTVVGLWSLPHWRQLLGFQPVAITAPPRPGEINGEPDTGQPADGGTNPGEPAGRRTWRVAEGPLAADGVGTLGEALDRAGQDDIIECAFSGGRDLEPLVLADRRLTLRGVPGHEPVLRFLSGGAGAAVTLTATELVLENIGVRLAAGDDGPAALCALGPGASLECRRVFLEVRRARRGAGGVVGRGGEPVFMRCLGRGDAGRLPGDAPATGTPPIAPAAIRLTFTDVEAVGDGTFLVTDATTPVELDWNGGRCVTSGRFLQVEGGGNGTAAVATRLSLTDTVLAHREGFAVLLDSPAAPVMPALRVTTAGCRFVTPAGRGFLEQVGIGLPDVYRAAVEWTDSEGTYEGSGVYRRIDGAAEREDIPFSQGPGGIRHLPAIGGWEEGDGWDFPPLRSRITAAKPDS